MTKTQQYLISLALVAPTAVMLFGYAAAQPTTATMAVPMVYGALYALISVGHTINIFTQQKENTK